MQPDFERTAAAMIAGTNKAIAAAVAPLLKRIEVLEARPLPERGEKGDRGEQGLGRDGVGLAGALIDRSGVLVLTLTDGTTRELGVVVGKDGSDGAPGLQGEPGLRGENGLDGADATLSDDEKVALAAMTLREAIEAEPLVELPPIRARTEKAPPIIVNVENHIPRKGTERTVVTRHDERGRIAEFERQEIGE